MGFLAKGSSRKRLLPGINGMKVVELEEEMMGKDWDALLGAELGGAGCCWG